MRSLRTKVLDHLYIEWHSKIDIVLDLSDNEKEEKVSAHLATVRRNEGELELRFVMLIDGEVAKADTILRFAVGKKVLVE